VAGTVELKIRRGITFSHVMKRTIKKTGVAIDNTGYGARLHVRAKVSSSTILLAFSSETPLPNGVLGLITLGGVDGFITLYLGATTTEALTFTRGVYDLELFNLTDPDDVQFVVAGPVVVKSGVTR
jgi:hypothetical protein